jgi:DNA-binding FrmR family transcriptional regulator
MPDQHIELRRQLQAVEGEITEMARLIEQGEDCLAVVRHGVAAKQTLGAIGLALIESHLRNEVMAVIACDDPDCRTHRVVRLARVYEILNRFLCPACRGKWQAGRLPAPSRKSKEKADV